MVEMVGAADELSQLDRDIAQAIRHEREQAAQAAWEHELLASLELLLEEHRAAFVQPAGEAHARLIDFRRQITAQFATQIRQEN